MKEKETLILKVKAELYDLIQERRQLLLSLEKLNQVIQERAKKLEELNAVEEIKPS